MDNSPLTAHWPGVTLYSIGDAVIATDAGTRVTFMNPVAEALTGWTAAEAAGLPLLSVFNIVDMDTRLLVESPVDKALRDGIVVGLANHTLLIARDGTERPIDDSAAPIRDEAGEVAGVVLVFRDITERRWMERQIQRQAQELGDAGRRKDEFLAMLSHELRNPMAPIFSALQLIGQQDGENELQQDARGVIGRQVRHLARLVDDLLEVSRISTGRIRLHLERVDLNGIVQRAVERVRPLLDRREQRLVLAFPDDVVWLQADATRLEQVVGNLLNNASKYTDPGGRIALSVEADAVVRVHDDGVGMDSELVPRIFDLFTQADESLDRSEGGLGIGLALVKNLVELHRGSVEAHSGGIGEGSEFVVRLPLAAASVPPPEPALPPAEAAPADPLRVLVVDDNQGAARMSGMLLRSWGYEVRVAHDGAAALDRPAGFLPQVVLLDIGLPDMDGYEVARHVRRNPAHEGVQLVAVTGYGQDSDRARSKEAGFDVHLVKPVEASDLRDLLAGIHPAEA